MMQKRISLRRQAPAFAAALLLALSPAAALAKNDKSHGHGHHDEDDGDGGYPGAGISVSFDSGEAQSIRGYFSDHPVETKPLPPGIAKRLARGKPLPPGIAKRYLPQGLSAELPPRPGYERIVVGNDVLLVSVSTGLIADIIADALR